MRSKTTGLEEGGTEFVEKRPWLRGIHPPKQPATRRGDRRLGRVFKTLPSMSVQKKISVDDPPDERSQIVARYSPISLTGLGGVCPRESYRQNTVIIRGERDRVPIVVLDHAPLGLKGSVGARFRLNHRYPGDQQSTNDELPKR